jgi:hypothetical protein
MHEIQEYFHCEDCHGKDFKPIRSFSLRFHKVNFSDEVFYDNVTEEKYECVNCGRTYSRRQIVSGLDLLKGQRKRQRS